ncbi:MAG: cyclopropane fatty acyl phospholipid synthase [Hyphomicrobiales bacterium]
MRKASNRQVLEELLSIADIRIDGPRPWDVRVLNEQFFERVLAGGSLALGESYMDGWWECEALDQLFDRVLSAGLDQKARRSLPVWWAGFKCRVANPQRPSRAFDIGEHHYDIGNELFSIMLDDRMNYSCAYWENAATLDAAQEAKLDLICRKLQIQPGLRLLDIGCGWGGLARYAAEKHGACVRGITVSRQQSDFARRYCTGLPVDIALQDYRGLQDTFDRIVSVGMFEHVGVKNYRTYMEVVHRSLKPGGLFLLHTIAGNTSVHTCEPWVSRYIFPNSMLPSARQITAAAEGLFVLEDWQSLGPHYDRTLMAWHANFVNGWERIKAAYGERFFRMWTYFLLAYAGSFRARSNQVWQIVFSKGGLRGGYRSIRV